MNPPEKEKGAGGEADAKGNRITNWSRVIEAVSAVKEPLHDPQLVRFHSALAIFFRSLRRGGAR